MEGEKVALSLMMEKADESHSQASFILFGIVMGALSIIIFDFKIAEEGDLKTFPVFVFSIISITPAFIGNQIRFWELFAPRFPKIKLLKDETIQSPYLTKERIFLEFLYSLILTSGTMFFGSIYFLFPTLETLWDELNLNVNNWGHFIILRLIALLLFFIAWIITYKLIIFLLEIYIKKTDFKKKVRAVQQYLVVQGDLECRDNGTVLTEYIDKQKDNLRGQYWNEAYPTHEQRLSELKKNKNKMTKNLTELKTILPSSELYERIFDDGSTGFNNYVELAKEALKWLRGWGFKHWSAKAWKLWKFNDHERLIEDLRGFRGEYSLIVRNLRKKLHDAGIEDEKVAGLLKEFMRNQNDEIKELLPDDKEVPQYYEQTERFIKKKLPDLIEIVRITEENLKKIVFNAF